MKRLHLLKSMLLLCALIVGSGTMWADTDPYYTLDTSTCGNTTSNSYGGSGTKTVDGIGWTFQGNGQQAPWRLGGKNISGVNRAAYTTTAMGAAISSIDLTVGTASSITVNSLTLVVASDASFKTVLDEVEEDFKASSKITFEPTSGSSWAKDAYYKFVFNVSVSGNDNKFVQFSKVEFFEYSSSGGSEPSIDLAKKSINLTKDKVDDGSITVTYNNITTVDAEVKFYESDGTTPAEYDWIIADIDASNNVEYLVDANTGSKRMAYMKVHQKNTEVYSDLITITQASGIDTPTFDIAGGTYTTPQNVTISCATDGSTIYYTTDGNDPTNESNVYESPVAITVSGTVLKAIAYKAGGASEIASATYTIRPEVPTSNLSSGTYLEGTGIELSSVGNTIRYNLTTDGTDPSNPTKTNGTIYENPIILSGNCTTKIKAIAIDTYGNTSNVTSRTYTVVAPTPTDLPFSWAGGGSDDFKALSCVFTGGLGTDYNSGSHSPYLIKFDTTDDCIIIFTNSQPGKINIGVKMIGGANTSTIKVQEGTTGTGTFTNVEDLTISGKQNTILNLSTTNTFATTTRVVKLLFVKGDNVGVGPISIAIPEASAPVDNGNNTITLTTTAKMAGWRSFVNSDHSYEADANTTIYKVASSPSANKLKLESISNIKRGTPVILKTSAEAEMDGTFKITLTEIDDEAADTPGDNLLKATTVVTNLSTTVYRLGFGSNNIGFYAYSNASAPAGIVYIDADDITKPDASRGVGMIFDNETTGIEAISNTQETVNASREIYNLNGQRVANPTKGLYIVNGKKVIIK